MSMQLPPGPIGHCSAKVRRMLEIEEAEALGRTVRIRKPDTDDDGGRKRQGGNRWARPAKFSVPGAFHNRFVSADGKVTFHFGLEAVSKTSDGGCRITTPEGSKRLALGAPAEHNNYIERPGAVAAIEPDGFGGYAERPSAVESDGDDLAIFSNIAPTLEERQTYWRAVHEHERTPGADRLTFVPEQASRAAWQRLADTPDLPSTIRIVAEEFAKTKKKKRRTRTIKLDELGLGRTSARELVSRTGTILSNSTGKNAIRLSVGRGGRSQYRLTAEFAEGLDAAGRLSITRAMCAEAAESGLMYVAAIHAPDHHNDRRNYHLHFIFHDRPAKMIGDKWDFEIAVPVEGQHKRVHYPYRQKKVGELSRDPDGGNHRAYGSEMLAEMRSFFADANNKELDRLGVTRKLHPGDLKSLGCERTAQKPLGTRAAPLEAAGVPTTTGVANAELLWTALLRESWEAAERRAKQRADLRRRLADAEEALAAADMSGREALAKLGELEARLNEAEAVLARHDAELAEYGITLAMARARPNKALETCRRMLESIDEGKASRSEQRARPAIAARAKEAEAFLADVAAVERANAPIIDRLSADVSRAQADVDAIAAAAAELLDREVPALLAAPRTISDDRAMLDALFERIMATDIPIVLPDEHGADYRVAGITRAEYRAITSPPLAHVAQKRLAAMADDQAKRMRAAALVVAQTGLDGVARAAANGQAGAARTLKHARAYAAHPVYLQALANATEAQRSPPDAAPLIAGAARGTGWTASLRSRISSFVGRGASETSLSAPEPSASLVREPDTKAPSQTTRDDAIRALATAVLAEPAIRVVKGAAGLVIDAASAPDWIRSVEAFSDTPEVRAAIVQRHRSPWLDVTHEDRSRELSGLRDALRAADRRPVTKVEGQWHVDLADQRLCDMVVRWRGYDALETVLIQADRNWWVRETSARNCVTSVADGTGFEVPRILRRTPEAETARELSIPVQAPAPVRGLFRGNELGR